MTYIDSAYDKIIITTLIITVTTKSAENFWRYSAFPHCHKNKDKFGMDYIRKSLH